MKKFLLILIPIVVLAGLALQLRNRSPETSYRTAAVDRGLIVSAVAATGTLNAVSMVQVGTQVSGTIYRLQADFNTPVTRNQIIAEIDPALFQAQLEQAEGNHLSSRANLEKARVATRDAARNLQRFSDLVARGFVSRSEFDTAETTYLAAQAAERAAEASVVQTRGSLQQARTNLQHAVIRSPVDGVVINRNVDVGQTVAASFQTPTLFTIAEDLTRMQIETSVDEADIGRVRVGLTATFTVDAWPGETFRGRVTQVRLAPVINQNVVTYNVVVTVANPEKKLFPGHDRQCFDRGRAPQPGPAPARRRPALPSSEFRGIRNLRAAPAEFAPEGGLPCRPRPPAGSGPRYYRNQ